MQEPEPIVVPELVIVRVEPEKVVTDQDTTEQARQCPICKPTFYVERNHATR